MTLPCGLSMKICTKAHINTKGAYLRALRPLTYIIYIRRPFYYSMRKVLQMSAAVFRAEIFNGVGSELVADVIVFVVGVPLYLVEMHVVHLGEHHKFLPQVGV